MKRREIEESLVEDLEVARVFLNNELYGYGIYTIRTDFIADSLNHRRIFFGDDDKIHSGLSFPNLRPFDILGLFVFIALYAGFGIFSAYFVEVFEAISAPP